jgi:hypothetical protein
VAQPLPRPLARHGAAQPVARQAWQIQLPGDIPRLQLRLERMASLPPQSWEIEFDATRHLHVAPLLEAALANS